MTDDNFKMFTDDIIIDNLILIDTRSYFNLKLLLKLDKNCWILLFAKLWEVFRTSCFVHTQILFFTTFEGTFCPFLQRGIDQQL